MRLVSEDLLHAYEGRMLNIHPSLLPKYKGLDAIGQAYESGDKVTGSTVHFVDSGMDTEKLLNNNNVILNRTTQRRFRRESQKFRI